LKQLLQQDKNFAREIKQEIYSTVLSSPYQRFVLATKPTIHHNLATTETMLQQISSITSGNMATSINDDSLSDDCSSLSSQASVSSAGQYYGRSAPNPPNVASKLEHSMELLSSNLIASNNGETFPSTLSLDVQEDESYLNNFYMDNACRPFRVKVRAVNIGDTLPSSKTFSGIVDSMTLFYVQRPYSVITTKAIVKDTDNNKIGIISKKFDLFTRRFKVQDVNGNIIFTIVNEKKNKDSFIIYRKKDIIGSIIARSGTLQLDLFSQLNNEVEKCLLLSTEILLKYCFYEEEQSQSFNARYRKKKQQGHGNSSKDPIPTWNL